MDLRRLSDGPRIDNELVAHPLNPSRIMRKTSSREYIVVSPRCLRASCSSSSSSSWSPALQVSIGTDAFELSNEQFSVVSERYAEYERGAAKTYTWEEVKRMFEENR